MIYRIQQKDLFWGVNRSITFKLRDIPDCKGLSKCSTAICFDASCGETEKAHTITLADGAEVHVDEIKEGMFNDSIEKWRNNFFSEFGWKRDMTKGLSADIDQIRHVMKANEYSHDIRTGIRMTSGQRIA